MKKIFIIAMLAMTASIANAQLKVDSLGYVQMGKRLLINAIDTVNWTNRYGIYCKHENYHNGNDVPCATSIYGFAGGCSSPFENTNVAIGVRGEADGGLLLNYGVYGHISSYGLYGAGVYGTLYDGFVPRSMHYAGFFDGPVGITSGLYLKGGITNVNSFRTQNNTSTTSDSVSSISEQLARLSLGTFYEQTDVPHDGTESSESRFFENANGKAGEEGHFRKHYGLEASQLKEVFPDLVIEDGEGDKYINYVEMVPILVQAVNELSAEVHELRLQLGIQETTKPVMKTKGKTEDADNVTLTFPNNAHEATLNIYDLSGKLLRTSPVNMGETRNLSNYTRGLPTGTYAYTLNINGQKQKARKVVVKN